jgi:hypothetical protein
MELNELILLAAAALLASDPLQRPDVAVRRAKGLWLEVVKQAREDQ